MDPRSLRALSRQLVRELGLFAPNCCHSNLTPVEAHLLIELGSGPLTNNQLAERLRVDKSNTSRPLTRLQERNLVTRQPHALDGRSQELCLTQAGASLLTRLHQDLDHQTAQVLAQLTPEEQHTLSQGLGLYLQGLHRAKQQQPFTLRPLMPEDQAAIAQVIRQVSAEYGLSAEKGYGVADPALDRLYAHYQGERSAYWVITGAEGEVMGGGGIAPLQNASDEICELQKMYFLPELRGKGLGKRLILHALAFARQLGYHTCYLETTAPLVEATRLYQQLGFTRLCAPLGNTGHCDCEIRMSLALEPIQPKDPEPLRPCQCGES
ncbi:MAG: bifunctional helix-turn-helix transcriptional regulator/GNAT family N-acetyltransferase [Aeromonadaceae bacterium]